MGELPFGEINGHLFGLAMKALMQRALVKIRDMSGEFEVMEKLGYEGGQDFVTTADQEAQAVYLRSIRECFPQCGIIAEESNIPGQSLMIPSTHPLADFYCTLDPIDGTKAWIRRQSQGIGTMVAFVWNGEVISAYVGDVNTFEIYYFRPGSPHVHRIPKKGQGTKLRVDASKPLCNQNIIVATNIFSLPQLVQSAAYEWSIFKDLETGNGSIGITMARLWKGEVGGVLLGPRLETPWDSTPINGISKKLGFVALRNRGRNLVASADYFSPTEFVIPKEIIPRDHYLLIVHESRLPELKERLGEKLHWNGGTR